jgi:hypothetical protein
MSHAFVRYESFFGRLFSGLMPIGKFQATYLKRFRNEQQLDKAEFNLLEQLSGDVDSFTSDQRLLGQKPDFHLDAAELRENIRSAADRSAALKT